MRSAIYPYDNMMTDDGFVWAVSNKGDALQAVVVFENISQRFLSEMYENPTDFIMRSRLCQLGLDSELTNLERPLGTTHRLECTLTLSYAKDNGVAPRVLDFVVGSHERERHEKARLGKLFVLSRSRRLHYEQVLQNVYSSGQPLIEVSELAQGPDHSIIIPADHVEYEYHRHDPPNRDQIRYLLSQGTRQDLDFFRQRIPRDLPLKIPPRGWILSQLPLFRVREHFAYIEGLTYKNEIVPELRHASARLFDPLSYGQNTKQMIEVFNLSDREIVFDGVAIGIYRPERRRCSVQIPATIRLSELLAPKMQLAERMDETLAGNSLANGKLVKHSAFLVDAEELEKLDEIKNTTISDAAVRSFERGDMKAADCPEYDILEEIQKDYIRASGFLLSYYFPRWDISSMIETCRDNIRAILFRRASQRNDPFFSEFDVSRLKYFHHLGIQPVWLRQDAEPAHYFMRDDCGFFMHEDLAQRFHAATFFACYGSSANVPGGLEEQLPEFFNDLRELFGEIGVVTGGGPKLMEVINRSALEAGILSASSSLSTDFAEKPQKLNQHSNIFMFFDEYCRHIRQKNFSIARFPVFFPGGVGTLEEVGIELCNLKLGVHHNAPYIFMDADYWRPILDFLKSAAEKGMVAPKLLQSVHLVNELGEAVKIYRDFIGFTDA